MLSSTFPIFFNEYLTFLALKIISDFPHFESFWQEMILSSSIKTPYQAICSYQLFIKYPL